jgi:ABC-type branched-subunit amino acid transport system substrate-binding protein
MSRPLRRHLALLVVATMMLTACKSTSSNTTNSSAATATTTAITDTRAPGVTADSIKIGVIYVDLTSLESVLHINQGDWKKAYQAIIDNINAKGGIHGRKLVATIVGTNPTSQSTADTACTKLTQDVKVFVAVGFFLGDNVLCYVDTNQTATIGGAITAERLAKAKAPWYSTDAGESLEINVVKTLATQAKLNGKLAIMATAAEKPILEKVKPVLAAAGIKPVVSAILDAPTNDPTATFAQAETISERFKSAGANQVLLVGEGAPGSFLGGMVKTTYRPQLIFSDLNGVSTYTLAKSNDFSILKGAISGGPFGPADARVALAGPTKACMDVQRAAGLVIKPSSQVPKGQPDQFVASALACQQMALLTAILQKAGPTLNYGTFAAAGNSLGKIVLPTFPDAWTFGAPPNADGNPKIYVFGWDPTTSQFEIEHG